MVTTGVGSTVVDDGSHPRRFINFRSDAVTGFTTPESENASNESYPALAAQSPKSPPGLVLK